MSSIRVFKKALTRYFGLVVCIGLILTGAGVLREKVVEGMNLEGSFDEQVAAVMARRQLQARDLRAVRRALGDTERALQSLWPDAKLGCDRSMPLGSLVTGLATPTSDVDCHVVLPSSHETNWSQVLAAAATTLQLYPQLFTNVTVHIGRVPVVQTLHVPTNRQFDIDFTEASHDVSNLMKYLLHLDKRFIKLAVIVKCWGELLKRKGERKISSHVFIIMVIFFLQQKQLLPPVVELQSNIEPVLRKHWNVAFQKINYDPKDYSLLSLLVGYFEFYANFSYDDHVISPFIGYPINKVQFVDYQSLPEEFRLYKHNIANNITSPIDLSGIIKVQDPFDHNLNLVSTHTMPCIVVQRALAAFKKATKVYQEISNPDEFLVSLLDQK